MDIIYFINIHTAKVSVYSTVTHTQSVTLRFMITKPSTNK